MRVRDNFLLRFFLQIKSIEMSLIKISVARDSGKHTAGAATPRPFAKYFSARTIQAAI